MKISLSCINVHQKEYIMEEALNNLVDKIPHLAGVKHRIYVWVHYHKTYLPQLTSLLHHLITQPDNKRDQYTASNMSSFL